MHPPQQQPASPPQLPLPPLPPLHQEAFDAIERDDLDAAATAYRAALAENPRDAEAVFTELHVLLHCERASQKPMLLGKGGATIKAIGSEARVGLEHLLGGRVHLSLHVTVLGEWQDDPKKLQRLGY